MVTRVKRKVSSIEWRRAGSAAAAALSLSLAGDSAHATDAGASASIPSPKVNQVGYLPAGPKTLHVTTSSAALAGGPVSILNPAGQVVWSGSLSASAIDDSLSTGESVLSANFSTFTVAGTYVASAGGAQSAPFAVGPAVYNSLYRDSLRAFYLIRCGVAIDDAETGIQHSACHLQDALLLDAGTQLELTGGWHNAGDFGKWTHEAAISTSLMMWLAELDPNGVTQISAGTPESGNGVSDLLNEARWGLTWLLKMLQADGSVLHKVDTQPYFAWGLPPQDDPYTRHAGFASTIDAADFTAVMLQAARVFRNVDAAFSAQCASAASLSWSWVQENPSIAETDIYYPDPDPSQEVLWATGEMLRATHDAQVSAAWSTRSVAVAPAAIAWPTPQVLGYAAVALDPAGDPTTVASASAALQAFASSLSPLAGATGYGVVTQPADYFWGSNETLLGTISSLLFAYATTQNADYRDLALAQLGWLLGDNALNRSFVTAHGTNPVMHPYHWTYHALGEIMPGWPSGGPNEYDAGVDAPLLAVIDEGTPPAKCYVDEGDALGSWASNEGEIVENAELLFATGYFTGAADISDAGADVGVDAGAAEAGAPATSSGGGCGCVLAGAGNETRSSGLVVVSIVAIMAIWTRLRTRPVGMSRRRS